MAQSGGVNGLVVAEANGMGAYAYGRLKLSTLVIALILGGWLALPASAQDLGTAATVVTLEGQVSVLRNGDTWALFAGNTVRVNETIITGPEGFAKLQISDGSSFDVYPNSRVVFRANPGNLKELVEVYLGRIKVYIQTFGGRPNPYRVHSPTAVISVRGTVFDVVVEQDTITWVGVDEGVVEVMHRLLPGRPVPLLPGQSLRVFPNASLASAGINKAGLVAKVAGAVRDVIYSMPRMGGGRSATGGTPPAGTPPAPGGGLPTDTGAPTPPPPPPSDKEAPPPPPPPPGSQ
jgi:hypothetical protein